MTPPLDGSVLVTGASSGIGEVIARMLAPRARRLVLVARREERLQALADELRAAHPRLEVEIQCCDLVDPRARRELLEALDAGSPIDVLVNNAGFGDQSLFERAQWTKLDRMIALNIGALTQLVHHLLPGMIERGRGGVLNISSGFGLSWVPGLAVYIGTKHYVTGFTESLRAEVIGQGIVVSQVCPGPVLTEFHDVTENTTGQRPPRFVMITAEQCAREALRGFERGRAIIVPGFYIRNLLRLDAITPRWLWRRLLTRSMRSAA